jgi:hypothetical protein
MKIDYSHTVVGLVAIILLLGAFLWFPQNSLSPINIKMVYLSDECALKGFQKAHEHYYIQAVFYHSLSNFLLPFHEVTKQRRRAYKNHFKRAVSKVFSGI